MTPTCGPPLGLYRYTLFLSPRGLEFSTCSGLMVNSPGGFTVPPRAEGAAWWRGNKKPPATASTSAKGGLASCPGADKRRSKYTPEVANRKAPFGGPACRRAEGPQGRPLRHEAAFCEGGQSRPLKYLPRLTAYSTPAPPIWVAIYLSSSAMISSI